MILSMYNFFVEPLLLKKCTYMFFFVSNLRQEAYFKLILIGVIHYFPTQNSMIVHFLSIFDGSSNIRLIVEHGTHVLTF